MSITASERVQVVGPGRTYVGKQGFTYGAGASAETVGAAQICMNILPMSADTRANAHYHEGIETIAYMLTGECAVYYGNNLEQRVLVHTGDQIFIPVTCHMRRSMKAHRVPGSWCIRLAAIRTALSCYQSLMRASRHSACH